MYVQKTNDSGAGANDGAAAPLEQPFPGYEVLEKIAQGGMGAVFLARDLRLDREVAIKALVPHLASHADAVEQFFNESRNVARLRHPGIVRGLDVGRAGKYFYFVMEYARGETLAAKLQRLERGRLPEKESLEIVRQAAEALQYIFENGLVHRDLKPVNLILDGKGGVKLCDLGVAREIEHPGHDAFVKGSPDYASPEQITGDPNVDIRADLYGLGCTWYHMLTGQPPFRSATPEETLRRHLHEEPKNLRELDPRLSAATSELVRWLLMKDRDERPRTPQAFLARLMKHPRLEGASESPAAPAPTAAESATEPAGDDEEE